MVKSLFNLPLIYQTYKSRCPQTAQENGEDLQLHQEIEAHTNQQEKQFPQVKICI